MAEREGGPAFDIEALKKAQEAHDRALKEAEDREAAKAEDERIAQSQAGGDRESREAVLKELKQLQAEADELEEARIKERLAASAKLKETELAKQAELEATTGDFTALSERLNAVRALVAGKKEAEIATDVREAITQLEVAKAPLETTARELTGELEKIRADQVSDEQVKRYHEIQAGLSKLNQTVAELESNPYLIELLVAEAETENELREDIVQAAVARSETYWRTNEERRKFDEQVAERFLSEEIEARGINLIADRRARKEALEQLAQGMISGMRLGGVQEIYHQGGGQKQVDALTGLALLNLVGGHGTLSGTTGFLRMSEAGFSPTAWQDQVAEKKAEAQAIHNHLGSLNLLRAYGTGMPRFYDRVLTANRSPHEWEQFDRELWGLANVDPKLGIDTRKSGPLIPRNASAAEKKAIEKDFERNRKQAEALEAKLTTQERGRLGKEIEELTGRLESLRELRTRQEEAKRSLKRDGFEQGVASQSYDWRQIQESLKSAGQKLDSAQDQLQGTEQNLARYREALGKLGALSLREKGRLKGQIRDQEERRANIELEIKQLTVARDELQQKVARIESSDQVLFGKKREWEVQREIEDMERTLEERRRHLAALEKKG